MKSFGLGDVVVRWIEAYLSGRVLRVHVGGEHSGAIPMHSGVPWWTLIFADDVKMVTRRSQSMNLHSSLTTAWDWLKKWNLPINPTKYHTRARSSPQIVFFSRWVWYPIPVSKLSKI